MSSGWAVGPVKCLACAHQWVAVRPADSEPPYECSQCHTMEGQPDARRWAWWKRKAWA